MNRESVFLRAFEPSELSLLIEIENEQDFWKYSNRTEPFSEKLLKAYLEQQHQDIFQAKQKRYVLSDAQKSLLGFVDLFDFAPLYRRAGVGIVILKDTSGMGLGKYGLQMVDSHCREYFNIHCLFANIARENKRSLHIFESCGYQKIGIKKACNFYEDSFHDAFLSQKLFYCCIKQRF